MNNTLLSLIHCRYVRMCEYFPKYQQISMLLKASTLSSGAEKTLGQHFSFRKLSPVRHQLRTWANSGSLTLSIRLKRNVSRKLFAQLKNETPRKSVLTCCLQNIGYFFSTLICQKQWQKEPHQIIHRVHLWRSPTLLNSHPWKEGKLDLPWPPTICLI